MNAPRLSQGAAILLWGWQVDLFLYAVPMAALLELHHLTRRRWNLERSDLYRVADLTTVLLIGLIVYLWNSVPLSHFLLSVVELAPALFYPLVLALAYSTTEKMPLDVLFYSLRRQPDNQSEWDIQYLYIGVCLVATGTNTGAYYLYLPLCAAILCWSLWPARARRYPTSFSVLAILAIFAAGTALHVSLHQAHLAIKERTTQWLADLMDSRFDPFRTSTALGMVGRLKFSDEIVMRVARERADGSLLYLHEASYDWLSRNEWMAMRRNFEPLTKIDQFAWQLSPPDGADTPRAQSEVRIYQELERDRGLVPLPPGTVSITDYPALELTENEYHAVQATGIMSAPVFRARYSREPAATGTVEATDLGVPEEFERLMESEAAALVDGDPEPEEIVRRLRDYFAPFRYTLYQPAVLAREDPIQYFLTERRAGHCEFFASATVLLLRQAGIPARYSVGYVVGEYDPLTGLDLVRKSHAHAWAQAYINGRWQIVDTTPSVWLEMEADASSPLRPLIDLVANLAFKFALWREQQRLEDYANWLYGVAFLLTLFLVYRLTRAEQVMVESGARGRGDGSVDWERLPFYRIEAYLTDLGEMRMRGEPLLAWIRRIGREELRPLVEEHYAWRFDPRGLSNERQTLLDQEVERWLEQAHAASGRTQS